MAYNRKTKSSRQARYLLSGGSPLTPKQKKRLKGELSSGAVKIKRKARGKRK